MTNGFHKHTCSICKAPFTCQIISHCFIEDRYAVCSRPECEAEWEKPKREDWDEDS